MPKSNKKKARKQEDGADAEAVENFTDDVKPAAELDPDSAAAAYKEKLLFDMIDYEQEYVLVDREGREKHWKFLLTLWEMYPEEKKEGRLNLRFHMCQILMDACGKPAYSDGSLVIWDAVSWAELKEDISELKSLCSTFKRNLDEHERTARLCDKIIQSCEINKIVAPIRKRLEEQIKDHKKVAIRKSAIDQVFQDFSEYDETSIVKEYLADLFQKDGDNYIATLKDLDQLGEILGKKPYDLRWIQSKIETLMFAYNDICFPEQQPTLWKHGYNLPNVARLTTARKSSVKKEKVGKSPAPVDNMIAEADEGGLYKVKPSAMRLSFEDTDDEYEPPRLGSIKRKRRRMSAPGVNPSIKSRYKGEAPDDGVFGEFGLVKERRPYSDEEINAIIAGVIKHGVGKWVEIKNEYGHILRNRSSVQVKDKYRTLKRKRQLPVELLEAEDGKDVAKDVASSEETPAEAPESPPTDGMVAEL